MSWDSPETLGPLLRLLVWLTDRLAKARSVFARRRAESFASTSEAVLPILQKARLLFNEAQANAYVHLNKGYEASDLQRQLNDRRQMAAPRLLRRQVSGVETSLNQLWALSSPLPPNQLGGQRGEMVSKAARAGHACATVAIQLCHRYQVVVAR